MQKIIWILLLASFISNAPVQGQMCTSYDRWSLESANLFLALAEALLLDISDCTTDADRQACYDTYENLLEADDHLHQVMIGNIKNDCMTCDLSAALNVAYTLDNLSRALYNANYGGQNIFDRNISLEMEQWIDDICPDISGSWYPTNYPNVTINIVFDNVNNVFNAEFIDGANREYDYLWVRNSEIVELNNTKERGRIYNNGNNIIWSNHEWVRKNTAMDGSWKMDEGDILRIVKTANGQYDLYIDKIVALATVSTKFTPGEFFGEIWTQDHVHFKGYLITKEPVMPQAEIYLKFEEGILFIDDTDHVFQSTNKAGKLRRM